VDLRKGQVFGCSPEPRAASRQRRRGAPASVVGPRFEEIEAERGALSELRDKPAGAIRITTTEHAAYTILWPKLVKALPEYPDIKAEIIIEQGLTGIVRERDDSWRTPW
jgi:hypothetical protein